jgi:cell wall-associated NlpC family hydrolase
VREVPAEHVIEIARRAIGWPFQHQGRDERGIDCIGLLFYVGIQTGLVENLSLPDYFWHMNYSRLPTQDGPDAYWLLNELGATFIRRQPSQSPQKTDIVYCRNEKWVHVGIVTPKNIIHAYAGQFMKVCEHPYDQSWRDRTVAVFAWPGVI